MSRQCLLRGAVLLVLLPALAVLPLVAPSTAEAQKKKVVNIAAKEPDTLDPHTSILGQTQAIVRFMYRGLTRFAIKDGKVTTAEVEPDLAESWTLSPDGKIVLVRVRLRVMCAASRYGYPRIHIDPQHQKWTLWRGLAAGTDDL